MIFSNVYAAALEWLIENPSPTEFTDDSHNPTDMSLSAKFVDNVNDHTIVCTAVVYTIHINNLFSFVFYSTLQTNTTDNIESLLEIIRIYGQRDAPPSTEIVQLFVDMGFDETTAREALRVTGNQHTLACEWLVGNRSKTAFERVDGLPIDSPILNTLLDSPHIQLSLSSPKIFFGTQYFSEIIFISLSVIHITFASISYFSAYLSILEDYAAMGMWLNDNETSSIIGQILRTYHEEKHIFAINEFSDYI